MLFASVLCATGLSSATAQSDAEAFFHGKEITFIVPYKPGGGYDQYARLIEPYLEEETGARIDVVNLPGSGAVRGTTELFRAPSDGLHIGILPSSALLLAEMADPEGVRYRVGEFTYFARVASEPRVLIATVKSGITNFDDVLSGERELLLGVTGIGGSTYLDSVITGSAFGLNQKLIRGFDSSADVRLAMLRGDVNAMWGSSGSVRKTIASGDAIPILHTSRAPDDILEGVQGVQDLSGDLAPEQQALLDAWVALSTIGRTLAGPPNMPEDRALFLREAVMAVLTNPAFLADTEKAGRIVSVLDADSVVSLAKTAADVDGDVREALVSAHRGGR